MTILRTGGGSPARSGSVYKVRLLEQLDAYRVVKITSVFLPLNLCRKDAVGGSSIHERCDLGAARCAVRFQQVSILKFAHTEPRLQDAHV
jgi:hypothetical protein